LKIKKIGTFSNAQGDDELNKGRTTFRPFLFYMQ
jgi:hypothetical protein